MWLSCACSVVKTKKIITSVDFKFARSLTNLLLHKIGIWWRPVLAKLNNNKLCMYAPFGLGYDKIKNFYQNNNFFLLFRHCSLMNCYPYLHRAVLCSHHECAGCRWFPLDIRINTCQVNLCNWQSIYLGPCTHQYLKREDQRKSSLS